MIKSKEKNMIFDYNVLDDSEKLIYALRSLYRQAGFTQYRMSKFEEYDLYSKNKDFLVSENIITFTDTNGKLMALKPDVTLSIIKNNGDEADKLKKLCYNENVYRVSAGSGSFGEIAQSGVECIGSVDEKCISDVIELALSSLALTGENFVLELSQLDILAKAISRMTDDESIKRQILEYVSEKNVHDLEKLCNDNPSRKGNCKLLIKLLGLYGTPAEVLPQLKELCEDAGLYEEYSRLEAVIKPLEGKEYADAIRIDFSLADNMNYYNGIIFKGFVEGIPESVLSGGQYDSLMKRMDKESRGIGFAVYLENLEGISID